jgi:hypothetical protein
MTLAQNYVAVLTEWLSPEQLREVRRLNATADYDRSCAAHDFCDANMAMLEAWERTFNAECPLDDASLDVINIAVVEARKELRA